MDDLDNAIEQTLKTNDKARMGATVADPLDAAVGNVIDMGRTQQRASLRSAATVNPDEAARANALATKRNLPPDVVLRNLPEVQRQDTIENADAVLATSPALAKKMRELPFAQVAHDNVEALAGIESQIKTYGEFRALRGPEPTLGSYLSGVWQSVVSRTKQADIGLSMQVSDLAESLGFGADPVRRQELKRRYAQAQSDASFTEPEFKSDTAKGIYSGVSSTVSMLPATAMSIISRNPTPALAAMGLQSEAEAYGKYRTRGATAGEALVGGVGEGAVEVLTEKIPMGFLVDKFGKTGAKQFLSGMLLREVPSEQIATLLQDAIDTAVANPEKTWGEYLEERPGAAYQTLLATLVQAGTMGGASAVVQKVAERAQREQQVADQDATALTALLAASEKDKLRERDPQAFAALVQASAEQHGAPTDVYIDANALVETLAQSGMTPEQINAALPSASKTLGEAVAAGGDVTVPIGEFTALVAGSGMEAQLAKHTRLSPDALSQEDAKLLAKVDLKAETEKVMVEQEVQAEGVQVRQQLLDQLNTAGRFSPAVNAAYADSVAALYETQAARLGISVQEFAQRYPLKVEGFGTDAASLDQNKQSLDAVESVWSAAGISHTISESDGTIEVSRIVVPKDKRGQGAGTQAMRELLDYADATGQRVVLTPSSDFGGTKSRLVSFYKGLGFKPNKGKSKDFTTRATMIREPAKQGSLDQPAYHGTPHTVDKFTTEKIGTGEGFQAQGWGLYFAGNRDTAEFYKKTVGKAQNTDGRVYSVELPDDNVLLDREALVKDQPESVQKALEKLGYPAFVYDLRGAPARFASQTYATLKEAQNIVTRNNLSAKPVSVASDMTGKAIYDELVETEGSPEAASRALNAAGVPGLRYPDQYSRGANSESRSYNYVIFDDKYVEKTGELQQDAKGTFTPSTNTIALLAKADLSTFHHELGHFYLEVLADMASKPDAPTTVVEDMNKVLEWFGIKGTEATGDGSKTGELAQGGKLLGPDGKPLVVYHGSPARSAGSKFDLSKSGARTDHGNIGVGVYLTPAEFVAKAYAGSTGDTEAFTVNGSKMLTFTYDENYKANIEALAAQLGVTAVPEWKGPGQANPEWSLEFAKKAQAAGYIGAGGLNSDGTFAELVVFDPANLSPVSGKPLKQDGTQPESQPHEVKRTPLETWQAMSLEQQRQYHEKFARGYEAYLFEGKAPSTALSRAFQRFSEWMRSIYKSIRALNVEINDDIRRVYDRMLASEQAIKEAEAARAYAPLFADEKTIKEAGVDPASYHALGAEATANAIDQLQARSMRDMRWLANAKGRALKALQKDARATRALIEAEVTAEVNARPEYRAADLIAEADKEFAADPFSADPGLRRGAIADALGFTSPDAMAKAIEEAPPRDQVIEGKTDQRMLEEHGELSSPDALERAAEEAIRNEARGKFIATELAALDKAIGPVRVLVKAAKDFASTIIGRKVITEIKPNLYAAAETRAAKLAEKSLGKVEEAATAKRNQLLNHYAARYAYDAQNEIAKIREFFAKVANTPDDKVGKTRDMDVVNAARAVLAAYGVGRKGDAAVDYLKKVAAYDPEMSGVLQGSVDAALAQAKPLDELTFDELRVLNDEVSSLWYLAKRSRQMEVDGNLLDREEVQDGLKARLDEIGIPDTMPGDTSAITPAEARIAKLKTYLASARRTENWVEAMDGKPNGVFRSYIWQPIKEAADAYRTDKAAKLKKFRELLAPIADTLNKRLIEAPELGYTFGKDTGGVALNEILHAIAHTGNESNKRKLLLGRKWATENPDGTLNTSRWDAFISRMAAEKVLTKEHFDFVQGVWNLLEETKPLAQKTHRDVFGKYFAEITAETVDTPFGPYPGGYVPAQADPRIVSDAQTRKLMEDENASMAFAFPSTNKGFTKSRVEYNRPLMLDLGTLAQHIDKVLLFGHMERHVRDVRRVLTSKGVAYGVNRIDPAAFDSIVSPWLNRAARQQVTTPSPGHWQSWRLWSTLRNRAGMAAMFGNTVNAAQQITGFSIAAVKVRPKFLLSAMADFVTNPRQMANTVAETSPYMAGRMRNEVAAMNDQIKDILIDPSLYERAQQWSMRHAYFLQSAVDNVMSPIIWTGAYNQALEQGHSEKDAARFADSTVRTTQGSTLPEDISNWEAGSSFSRMFSQFAGYFNMQANLLGTEFQTIARDMGLRKGAGRGLYVLTLAFLAPAWISELIVQAARGGPDDEDKDGEYLDDWLASVFGMSTLRGATAMIPIFGQAANAVGNATNSKPYDDRIATSPAISMLESAAKAPTSVYKAAFEDGDKSKAVKDVASLISMLTGIPANIAARPLSYMTDVAEGDVTPTSAADAARGVVTGRASPGSK